MAQSNVHYGGVKPQGSSPLGSAYIYVMGGGNVSFVFNSLKDYANGVTLANWTTIGISLTDNAANFTTWNLQAEAQDASLIGSNPANTLDLRTIELYATPNAGCSSCHSYYAGPLYLPLPAPTLGHLTPLVDGSNAPGFPADEIPPNLNYSTAHIAISYRCGVNPLFSVFDKVGDYYTTNIYFTLEMDP